MAHSAAIRRATSGDRESILDLWVELIDYHRRLDPLYPVVTGLRAALRDEIERALRGGPCRLFLADQDGTPVGFLFAEVERGPSREASGPGTSWIHELYVVPGQRRRGLGRSLVGAAEKFVEELGGGRLAVRVESGNEEGLRFWKRRDFVERARILEKS